MKRINFIIKFLSLYQILGGLLGCTLEIYVYYSLISVQNNEDILFYTFLSLSTFILFIFSIFCGFLLLKKKLKGLKFSFANQILQVLNFSVLGFGFKYISGVYASIGYDLTHNSLIFKWGLSSWEILFQGSSELSEVHLNFIALLLVIAIDKLIKKLRDGFITTNEFNKELIIQNQKNSIDRYP